MNGVRWQIGVVAVLLLVLAAGAAAPLQAQEPEGVTRDDVNAVADGLYCPLCTGISVDVCEIQICQQMRDVIAQKLAAGESEEQIRAYFVEQYGQKVLAQPEKRGVNLIAWVLPGAFLLAGLGGAIMWLRSRPDRPAATAFRPVADGYTERLERELQRLDS
ncbi:MAG TPA: cytochrome c-type biogenesis protein CcmH [Ardenticatenaceae bacterium]|nr:cytochrome c-type biogenesis protein CcmH [Ardenticatenaceae bacterium]